MTNVAFVGPAGSSEYSEPPNARPRAIVATAADIEPRMAFLHVTEIETIRETFKIPRRSVAAAARASNKHRSASRINCRESSSLHHGRRRRQPGSWTGNMLARADTNRCDTVYRRSPAALSASLALHQP